MMPIGSVRGPTGESTLAKAHTAVRDSVDSRFGPRQQAQQLQKQCFHKVVSAVAANTTEFMRFVQYPSQMSQSDIRNPDLARQEVMLTRERCCGAVPMAQDAASAGKPIRKIAASAVKPTEKLTAPWKRPASAVKPTAKHTAPWKRHAAMFAARRRLVLQKYTAPWKSHAAKSAAKTTVTASKPIGPWKSHAEKSAAESAVSTEACYWRAQNDATSSYESHQPCSHKMCLDMHVAWYTVFDSNDVSATPPDSWHMLWGRFLSTLKAIFRKAPGADKPTYIQQTSLTNVLEEVKATITYQDPLLLLDETAYVHRQMKLQECFSKLVQKTSDVSIWHAIRDELLRNGRCSSLCRETHASIIEGHLQRNAGQICNLQI